MFEAFSSDATLFLIVFVLVLAIAMFLQRAKRKRTRYWRGRDNAYRPDQRETRKSNDDDPLASASEQLRRVMAADFKSRALLNHSESQVFKALDAAVIARNADWQVMAQVSLGEFLSSRDKLAFLSVNSKRVDFALMDPDFQVRHAIEYQGNGHHQGSAAARDAVKKEALRKAGIGYHEVVAGHTTPAELRRLIEKLVPAKTFEAPAS